MHTRINLAGTIPERNIYVSWGKKRAFWIKWVHPGTHSLGQSAGLLLRSNWCFNCLWRPKASTAEGSSVIDSLHSEHRGIAESSLPSTTVLEIWPISGSAFGIIISLKDHIMLYLACVKNNFVSSRHLGSWVKVCFHLKLDWCTAAWRELCEPYPQNWNLDDDFYRPHRVISCLSQCGLYTLWMSYGEGFFKLFILENI